MMWRIVICALNCRANSSAYLRALFEAFEKSTGTRMLLTRQLKTGEARLTRFFADRRLARREVVARFIALITQNLSELNLGSERNSTYTIIAKDLPFFDTNREAEPCKN